MRALATVLTALHPFLLASMATSADDPDRALRYLLLLFISGLAHGLLWAITDFFVAHRLNPLTYELKRILFNTVWADDYRHFVDRPSGKVSSHVNDIRRHVQMLFDSAHYGFLPMIVSIPVYVVILLRTSPANAGVYLLFVVGACVVLAFSVRPVHRRQRHLTDTTAVNNGRVFDSYSNFVNVFSFRAQGKEITRNDDQIDGLITDDRSFSHSLSLYWAIASMLIRGLLWAAIIGFNWFMFDQGRISFTAMVIAITVLVDFTSQYWNVVHFIGEWVDKSAAYREGYTYLFPGRNVVAEHYKSSTANSAVDHLASDSKASDEMPNGSTKGLNVSGSEPRRLQSHLEFRNVSFAYPDQPDQLILDDVSLRVTKGEKIGVVGRSGEGKSTLIKLLLGFYAPTSGQILVDGEPVGPDTLARLQAYVPQDTSLFQETIEYNIGYGVDRLDHSTKKAATSTMIRDAAVKARIDEFITGLPSSYDTLVGERGIKLSLGQRQRIAIARAFLKDADLLVLDEATSALDSETESLIQASLVDLWDDKAAIIVAHRLATLNDVDRIVVIEHGQVAEMGTRDELLAQRGRFSELWNLQRSGMISF